MQSPAAARRTSGSIGADGKSIPLSSKTYRWYAGDIKLENGKLIATPMELGATNLTPSDPIKHSNKGAVAALIIEPEGAIWTEDPGTRTSATVTANGDSFREFVLVFQDDINLRYEGNQPIPPIA